MADPAVEAALERLAAAEVRHGYSTDAAGAAGAPASTTAGGVGRGVGG